MDADYLWPMLIVLAVPVALIVGLVACLWLGLPK